MNIPVLALAAVLGLAPAARAQSAPALYDAKSAPLDDLCKELLTSNGYEIRESGQVWDKISAAPVAQKDMPYLLSRLASAKRLRALLEINNIIGRYSSESKMTPEDKEAVRALVRQNWVVFGVGPRNDFRPYFPVEEREALDKIPARFETMASPAIGDLSPESVTATPAAAAPTLGVLKPWTPPARSTAAVVSPAPTVSASTASVAVSSAPVPAVAPLPAAPPPQKIVNVDATEYSKFVAEGPYTKEGKALLELIGQHAPEYCQPLLRRTLVGAVPQIVSDGARTGRELRAGFTRDITNPLEPPIIALSPGPVFIEVKKGLFEPNEIISLPESAQVWVDLGLARPPLDVFRDDVSPISTKTNEWGTVREYADGSRRGSYTKIEQAGELLEQLLLLGLEREGLGSPEFAARRWARTARLMFYARFKQETGQDNFLDPERRTELRDWLDRPDEADDALVAAWSGPRLRIIDPARDFPSSACSAPSNLDSLLADDSRRRAARVGEIESLLEAGVVDASTAKAAAQAALQAEETERRRLMATPPVCPNAEASREEKRKAALLMAEAGRAESLVRKSSESAWTSYEPSQLLRAELPSGWQPFGEESPSGPIIRLLGPDDPSGSVRTTLTIRLVDRNSPNFMPAKDAIEVLRNGERDVTAIRPLRVEAGLARTFEITEIRRMPPDMTPNAPIQIHQYVAVLPRGEAYFVIRLLTARENYLDFRDDFVRFLKSLR